MYKAKKEMVGRFQRNKKKMESYLEVLNRCWIHSFVVDSMLKNLRCIGIHNLAFWNSLIYTHGDLELLGKLNEGMRIYKNFEGDFARQAAIRDRNIVMSDQWWDCYGCSPPLLQKLAICHQKLNDLVHVRYNLRLQQSILINFSLKTLDDHSNWVLEESPPFLTCEEVEALRNDLANMPIQSTLDDINMFLYNINKLNLDEDEDDDVPQPLDNTMEDVNPNESNIGEEPHSFDGEGLLEVDSILAPWI
ncbi:hypothetical protein GmHk_20G056957 [Glycine max]|nr:hypothetical protein GmHk_20G056957 [Glycine max]